MARNLKPCNNWLFRKSTQLC